jgi:predicted CXXCH cytochrome family protein
LIKIVAIRHGILILILSCLFLVSIAYSGSIVGSRHDLNDVILGNPGFDHDTKINVYLEVCVYCHTPHGANTNVEVPLWNRQVNNPGAYTLYDSSTMDSKPTTVSGVSLACLSCHDGTIAVDSVINPPNSSPGYAPFHAVMVIGTVGERYTKCGGCHTPETQFFGSHDASASYLSTDLSNDHPISMTYPTDQPTEFSGITNGKVGVLPLYNGKVECSSCHNVHDPAIKPFLKTSNSGSALCKTCHLK